MAFMDDLRSRLANRVQLTTDGHKAYLEAVEGAFGERYRLRHAGEAVRRMHRRAPRAATAPAECIGARKTKITATPTMITFQTSYVERQNLTMRMSMRRFTRLTNAHSKKLANHHHAQALYFMYYNSCGSIRP